MKCKKCNKEFHYCNSCSPEPCNDEGCCSDSCLKDYYDYASFYKAFKTTLRKSDSCFIRDVLRTSKEDLWESWIYWEEKRLNSLRSNNE